MEYISTRNKNLKYNFKDIFFRGLAPDGGLFIPNQIKKYNEAEIKKLSTLNYVDLATEIIFNFCSSSLEKNKLKNIIKKSYKNFSSKDDVFIGIMEKGWKQLWEGIESLIVEEAGPRVKFIGIIREMGKIVTDDKTLYGFLFTAPNFIHDSGRQSWKTYQERLYAILQSIIEDGIKKKEFVDLNPGLLMKAIGGLFHQLLISNDQALDDGEFEIMLKKIESFALEIFLENVGFDQISTKVI